MEKTQELKNLLEEYFVTKKRLRCEDLVTFTRYIKNKIKDNNILFFFFVEQVIDNEYYIHACFNYKLKELPVILKFHNDCLNINKYYNYNETVKILMFYDEVALKIKSWLDNKEY